MIETIETMLRKNDLWANVYENKLSNEICVQINWGDWKHDHLKCKWIMLENGFEHTKEEIIDEDGSDCYSSIHYFVKKVA